MIKFYGVINRYGVIEKIDIEELKKDIKKLKNDNSVRSISIIDNFGNMYKKVK